MKRIALFLATNLAVILVISIVLSVLGINSRSGGMGQMLAYAAVVGFTGSIISLLLSKTMAKHSVGRASHHHAAQRSGSMAAANRAKPSPANGT